jgi:transposase-like protein
MTRRSYSDEFKLEAVKLSEKEGVTKTLAFMTEGEQVRRILEHVGEPTDPPPAATVARGLQRRENRR